MLRRDDPEERPVGVKAILVTVHLFVSLGGILVGFLVVCVAMIKFGRPVIGAIGLGLLGLIPLWVIALFWFEWKHGLLYEHPSVREEPPQSLQNKF